MQEINEKQKRGLLRIATIIDDGELGIVAELNKLEDRIDVTHETLDKKVEETRQEFTRKIENIQLLKGDKGDSVVGPPGPKGDTTILEKVIEKTEVIREQPIVTEITKVTNEIKEVAVLDPNILPKYGEKFRDGLELLKDDERIDIKAIKGIEKTTEETVQFLKDWSIQILDQRTSFLIQKVNNLSDKVNSISTVGGGISVETPTGTVNGVNTVFTVSNTPKFISIDGVMKFAGLHYTYAAGTITIIDSVPPALYIRSFY